MLVPNQALLSRLCLTWHILNNILSTIVRFTLNSSTRIIEFRGFLSQFSTNFHEILHTLFSIRSCRVDHVVSTLKVLISTCIVEVRPFDM